MLVAKASLAFKNYTPSHKIGFGENVINQLTIAAGSDNNPFPDLPVSLKNLNTANNTLQSAVAGMNQGGKAASKLLDEAQTAWNIAFSDTATYVSVAAEGVASVIAEAGFNVTKTSRSKKPLAGGIKGFSATVNHSKGAVTMRATNASDYAEGYLYTAVPEGVSVTFNGNIMVITTSSESIYVAVSSKKQIDLKAMPKARPYNFTKAAFNSAGTGAAAAFQEVVPQ